MPPGRVEPDAYRSETLRYVRELDYGRDLLATSYNRNSQFEWKNAILFDSDETVTWSSPAYRNLGGETNLLAGRFLGVFVLTTHQVLFVREKGIIDKTYNVDTSYKLEDIRGLSIGVTPQGRYVSISDSNGERTFHVDEIRNDVEFDRFKDMVSTNLSKIRARAATTDFAFLRDYMERGGLSLKALKCPQCGGPISLPSGGQQTKCIHCGGNIYAVDVLDKIKALIG